MEDILSLIDRVNHSAEKKIESLAKSYNIIKNSLELVKVSLDSSPKDDEIGPTFSKLTELNRELGELENELDHLKNLESQQRAEITMLNTKIRKNLTRKYSDKRLLAGLELGPKIQRKIETFRTGSKFKIGSLEIEPIHVDHSVPGAYGFIIYTSSGPVVYTGDLRRHGFKPQMTEEFIQKARGCKPVALLAEGTRITDPPSDENEQKVFNESDMLTSNTKNNLIFADFNFKDVDRVRTFYNVAKKNGRKLVVKIKDCYYLKYMSQDPNLDIPNYDDENIVIYKPKYRSGTYSDSDYYGEDRKFATLPNAKTADRL